MGLNIIMNIAELKQPTDLRPAPVLVAEERHDAFNIAVFSYGTSDCSAASLRVGWSSHDGITTRYFAPFWMLRQLLAGQTDGVDLLADPHP